MDIVASSVPSATHAMGGTGSIMEWTGGSMIERRIVWGVAIVGIVAIGIIIWMILVFPNGGM